MALLDTDQISAMAAGSPELLLPIVTDFQESGGGMLDGLDQALAEGRVRDAQGILHQLKGASGTIGLVRFSETCSENEAALKEGGAVENLGELRPLLSESVEAAREFLGGVRE